MTFKRRVTDWTTKVTNSANMVKALIGAMVVVGGLVVAGVGAMIDTKLTSLKQEFARREAVQKQFEKIRNQVDKNRDDVADLKGDLKALKSQLDSLERRQK